MKDPTKPIFLITILVVFLWVFVFGSGCAGTAIDQDRLDGLVNIITDYIEKKNEDPEKPDESNKIQLQENQYSIEISNSLSPDNIIVLFDPSFTGNISSVSLDNKDLKFGTIYNSRETWTGEKPNKYSYPSELKMETKDQKIYATQILTTPEYVGSSTGNNDIDTEPNIVPSGSVALKYHGFYHNRYTFYTHRNPLLKIGTKVFVKVGDYQGTFTAVKRSNGSIGYEKRDGFLIKNSDVGGRGIAVLMPYNYSGPYKPAYITYK